MSDASVNVCVTAFESCWLSKFWPPGHVLGYNAFNKEVLRTFLAHYDIQFKPVPARRHSQNSIETKQGIRRSIFLRLSSADRTFSPELRAHQTVRIFNDLYGSNVLFAFELSK